MEKICLLLNLGGFEYHMQERLDMARKYGDRIFSLTGDGLVDVEEQFLVPVNVLDLTTSELMVWSGLINEQLEQLQASKDQVVILAAGKNYAGILPIGSTIVKGFCIGAGA